MKWAVALITAGTLVVGGIAAASSGVSPPPRNARGEITAAEVNKADAFAADMLGNLFNAQDIFRALPRACMFERRPNVPPKAVAAYRTAIALELRHLDPFVVEPLDDLHAWAENLPDRIDQYGERGERSVVHHASSLLLLGISHLVQAEDDLEKAGKGFRQLHCQTQGPVLDSSEELAKEGKTKLDAAFNALESVIK